MPYSVYSVANTGSVNERCLVRDSQGILWCCYQNKAVTYPSTFLAHSDDDGVTWVSELISQAGVNQITAVAMAIDSTDDLHIVYYHAADTGDVFYTRYRPGVGFISSLTLDASGIYINCVAVDSEDNVHVVYAQGQWNSYSLKHRMWSSALSTWTAVQTVSGGISRSYDAVIAVDSNNWLHAIWTTLSGGTTVRYNKRSPGATGVWGTYETIASGSSVGTPSIAVDASNVIHIVWEVAVGANNYGYKSGVSWIFEITPLRTRPSISCSADGKIVCIYLDASLDINYIERTGAGWQSPEVIELLGNPGDPSLMWARWPVVGGVSTNVLASGGAGVWDDPQNVAYDLNVRFSKFGVWQEPPVEGSAQLKGWTTSVANEGQHHKGVQTSWYRPTVKRIRG